MIIFNNLGHCFKVSDDDSPIVWVDSSDTSTYTLSGSDVLTLNNKGSLGGAMTLNGTVKFANGGFETNSASAQTSYISRGLNEPFLTNNSFTTFTTFTLDNLSFPNNARGWFSSLYASPSNRSETYIASSVEYVTAVNNGTTKNKSINANIGLLTCSFSYDLNTNIGTFLSSDGTSSTETSIVFNNSEDCVITLLKSLVTATTGTGNGKPLHEFRLYDRAFTLTEMQTLQTELNNKYTP